METQLFKGDPVELKIQDVAGPVFDISSLTLDEMYAQGFNATDFLLMLYDEKRMPFSERIARNIFVSFIKRALENFPFIGSFESYILILKEVFGENSELRFDVTAPGKLSLDIWATVSAEYDFLAREFIDGAYVYYDMIDSDGDSFIFSGIIGIDSEYELGLLFSEIMPAGISPTVTIEFLDISDFAGDGDDLIIGDDDTRIIFVEGGT